MATVIKTNSAIYLVDAIASIGIYKEPNFDNKLRYAENGALIGYFTGKTYKDDYNSEFLELFITKDTWFTSILGIPSIEKFYIYNEPDLLKSVRVEEPDAATSTTPGTTTSGEGGKAAGTTKGVTGTKSGTDIEIVTAEEVNSDSASILPATTFEVSNTAKVLFYVVIGLALFLLVYLFVTNSKKSNRRK